MTIILPFFQSNGDNWVACLGLLSKERRLSEIGDLWLQSPKINMMWSPTSKQDIIPTIIIQQLLLLYSISQLSRLYFAARRFNLLRGFNLLPGFNLLLGAVSKLRFSRVSQLMFWWDRICPHGSRERNFFGTYNGTLCTIADGIYLNVSGHTIPWYIDTTLRVCRCRPAHPCWVRGRSDPWISTTASMTDGKSVPSD